MTFNGLPQESCAQQHPRSPPEGPWAPLLLLALDWVKVGRAQIRKRPPESEVSTGVRATELAAKLSPFGTGLYFNLVPPVNFFLSFGYFHPYWRQQISNAIFELLLISEGGIKLATLISQNLLRGFVAVVFNGTLFLKERGYNIFYMKTQVLWIQQNLLRKTLGSNTYVCWTGVWFSSLQVHSLFFCCCCCFLFFIFQVFLTYHRISFN